MRFVIKRTRGGGWYVAITANNGKILAHSESYRRRREAMRMISIVQLEADGARIVDAEAPDRKGTT